MRQTVGAVGLLALAHIVAGTHCDSSSPCQASADAVATCATSCIESAAVTQAACATGDYKCQCDQQPVIQDAAANCIIGACGLGAALDVLNEVGALCSCVTANPTSACSSTSTTSSTSPPYQPPTTEPPTTTAPPTTEPPTTTAPPTTTGGCDSVSPCQASADAVYDCAKPCIESAAVTQASCAIPDYECQCDKAEVIQGAAVLCVLGNCGNTALDVLGQVSSLCGCVTAHPTVPCTSAPATTTAPPATTTQPPTTESTSDSSESVTTEPPSSTTGPITSAPGTTTAPACDSTSPCQASADAVYDCAKPCIESAAVTQASCATSDYECQCGKTDVIQGAAVNCVLGNCGNTALDVLNQVGSLCACVTAHPTTPCTSAPATTTAKTTTPPNSSETPCTTSSSKTTAAPPGSSSGPGGPGTTCKPGTTSDCGPVASSAVPSCAQACFSSAAPKIPCDVHDYACQCQPAAQSSLTQLLVPCVATACPPASLQAVIAGASQVCACATAPPSPGDCGTSPPATTTTGPGGPQSSSQPGGGNSYPPPPGTTTGPGTSVTGSNCQPVPIKTCDAVASSAVPSCAQACFTSAAPKIPCDVHDYDCQCKPAAQASLTQLLVPCVATACPPASLQAVITGASSVCACASASPTLIAPGTCQSSGPPGGGSSGGSGPSNTGGNGGSGSPTTTPGGGGGASATCKTEAPDCGAVATSAVPSCAQACFTSAAPKISCSVDDYACQCQPAAQASLSQILVPCVATACPAASLEAVITGASSVCACATGSSGSSNCGGSGGSGGSGSTTGGNGGGEGGSGGGEPTGGSGGEGGSGGNGGGNGGGSQPTAPPTIPPSAGSRLEMSLVAGVFALTWAIAVVL